MSKSLNEGAVQVPFFGQWEAQAYAGLIARIERSYIRRDIKTLSERTQKAVMPYLKPRQCPSCKGARLSRAALASRINGHNIADLSSLEVGDLLQVVRAIKQPKAGPIVHALVERLQAVVDIGIEYLSLNRETDTLSGGESQRVRMVKHLGSRPSSSSNTTRR
jgi:excinuclease UvrABC ATPase subunit